MKILHHHSYQNIYWNFFVKILRLLPPMARHKLIIKSFPNSMIIRIKPKERNVSFSTTLWNLISGSKLSRNRRVITAHCYQSCLTRGRIVSSHVSWGSFVTKIPCFCFVLDGYRLARFKRRWIFKIQATISLYRSRDRYCGTLWPALGLLSQFLKLSHWCFPQW